MARKKAPKRRPPRGVKELEAGKAKKWKKPINMTPNQVSASGNPALVAQQAFHDKYNFIPSPKAVTSGPYKNPKKKKPGRTRRTGTLRGYSVK